MEGYHTAISISLDVHFHSFHHLVSTGKKLISSWLHACPIRSSKHILKVYPVDPTYGISPFVIIHG
jgi:hypothetical protein